MPGTIDGDYVQEIEPGLTEHTYVYWDDYGKVSAWLLEADPARYRLVPTLAKGKIPGREAVRGIVARARGVAGINASYFAFKNITLGYTFPKKWLSKIEVSALRLFVTADNIMMFNHLDGMDPQYNFTGSVSYSYAPSRAIVAGIDIQF